MMKEVRDTYDYMIYDEYISIDINNSMYMGISLYDTCRYRESMSIYMNTVYRLMYILYAYQYDNEYDTIQLYDTYMYKMIVVCMVCMCACMMMMDRYYYSYICMRISMYTCIDLLYDDTSFYTHILNIHDRMCSLYNTEEYDQLVDIITMNDNVYLYNTNTVFNTIRYKSLQYRESYTRHTIRFVYTTSHIYSKYRSYIESVVYHNKTFISPSIRSTSLPSSQTNRSYRLTHCPMPSHSKYLPPPSPVVSSLKQVLSNIHHPLSRSTTRTLSHSSSHTTRTSHVSFIDSNRYRDVINDGMNRSIVYDNSIMDIEYVHSRCSDMNSMMHRDNSSVKLAKKRLKNDSRCVRYSSMFDDRSNSKYILIKKSKYSGSNSKERKDEGSSSRYDGSIYSSRLQYIIYKHREELNVTKAYKYYRWLDRDTISRLYIERRIQRLVDSINSRSYSQMYNDNTDIIKMHGDMIDNSGRCTYSNSVKKKKSGDIVDSNDSMYRSVIEYNKRHDRSKKMNGLFQVVKRIRSQHNS